MAPRSTQILTSPEAVLARLRVGARPRVLVVGDLVADRYLFGRTDRISREAPVLIVRHEREEIRLGGAANAAWNLAALGARVTALGVIGHDAMGAALRTLCAERGIRLRPVQAKGLHTETKTRILAGGVNTRLQQMLRLDAGQEGPLPMGVRRQVRAAYALLVAQADAVLVSDYGAGVLGPEVIAAVCQTARTKPVAVDSRYQLAAFTGVTVAKPNEPELAAATGLMVGDAAAAEAAGRALRKRTRAGAVLVTRGREGMLLLSESGIETIRPHGRREAIDVTGAGDAVIATLTAALAVGGTVSAGARLANVAGGIVVQKPGTATATVAELEQALRDEPEATAR